MTEPAEPILIIGTHERRRWMLESLDALFMVSELRFQSAVDRLADTMRVDAYRFRLVTIRGDVPADMIDPLVDYLNAAFERDEAAERRRTAGYEFVGSMADRGFPLGRVAEMMGVSQVRATKLWDEIRSERTTTEI